MRFTKMHGLGNDYVYIDCLNSEVKNPAQLSKIVSDRHFGIGSDGLVLISRSNKADFRMRMFNADGSEAEMCGNAIRCVGKYLYDNRITDSIKITIETLAGIKTLDLISVENHQAILIRVDMGEPILDADKIPVVATTSTVISTPIQVNEETFHITCVSMGNPHAIVYVTDVQNFDINKYGPLIENHPNFPKKTNVEFVEIVDKYTISMRVWERGSGETLACGTGACAVLVASVLNSLTDDKATIKLLGGELTIKWDRLSNHVYMTGSATKVFDGDFTI